jgi:uncharacterized protein
MSAPLYPLGAFDESAALAIAVLIGVCFGFVLERAGFGSARKLVSQFYLTDLAVFKVMFTAIVTAMVGTSLLSWSGWLDIELIDLVPTFWVAQVVGGLVLGVGFVVGGYCPGTSIVSTATGRLDGLAYVAGFAAGTLGFALAFPLLEPLYTAGGLGVKTLPEVLGLSRGLVVVAVLALAAAGFLGAAWIERTMASKGTT